MDTESKPIAVAYLRMSTDEQQTSIEIQRTEIEQRFGNLYNIVEWYIDEGKSGSHSLAKRLAFLRLMEDVERGHIRYLLCYSASRFSRMDGIETGLFCKVLRDHRVTLSTVLDGVIDFTSSTGRILNTVLAESNHATSVNLSKMVLDGKLKAFRDRKTLGQVTPYGLARLVIDTNGVERLVHRNERFTKPKHWTQRFVPGDEHEVEVVKWLFTEFDSRDVSFHKLAMELNRRGTPSPSGQRWVYQTVHDMLRNVRYAGHSSYGMNCTGEHHRVVNGEAKPNDDHEAHCRKKSGFLFEANLHEGIIPQELFDSVSAKVARRWRTGKHSSRDFALSGVLYCGHCGKPLYGNERSASKKNKAGVRYLCKGIHGSSECGQWGIREDEILPFIGKLAGKHLSKSELQRAQVKLPERKSDNVVAKKKRLVQLKSAYKLGIQKLLSLPKGPVSDDVHDELEKQRQLITKHEEELQTAESSESTKALWDRRFQFLRELRGQLLSITTATCCNGKYGTGYSMTREALRELLHRSEVRIDLFFERASSKRWKVSRGRFRVGASASAEFDSLASPELSNGAALIDVSFDGNELSTNREQHDKQQHDESKQM